MAEMLIQSETLTAIADKIRVLSGTEDAMGLDDMATHVGEANTDVATEAGLIEQIASALEGKAGGSGDTGSAMQFATGSVFTSSNILDSQQITISGLGFTPKSLIIYIGNINPNSYYMQPNKKQLLSLSTGELFDYNASVINIPTTGLNSVLKANDYYSVQFTQDGFILSFPDTTYTLSSAPYIYYAFG
jgi:hypothetical protein